VRRFETVPAAQSSSNAGSVTQAEPSACDETWQDKGDGLRYRKHGCEKEGDEFDLHVVEFDPSKWQFDALATTPMKASSAMKQSGAAFAINANFFDEARKPIGLIINGGKQQQPPKDVSWESMLLFDKSSRGSIVVPKTFDAAKADAVTGVQAGPRLTIDGKPNSAEKAQPSLRSGVCLTKSDKVTFFVSSEGGYHDVHEMIELASRPEADGGLGCRDAMLFDGGPSTQMAINAGSFSLVLDGDDVPAFVVAKPRESDAK
jgi:uncharacterized protein YigE (DUF2233 family)